MISEEVFRESLQRWRKALAHLAEVEAELLEHGFVPFIVQIMKGNRITVPFYVMNTLNLKLGDWILLPTFKLLRAESPPKSKSRRKKKSTAKPEPTIEEPTEELDEEPIVEPVAETESEVAEEALESEETPKASQVVPVPTIRGPFFKPEAEEDQEYVDPCPSGLDYPLQDITRCREWNCAYYKRKWGENPEACTWPDWLKIGWEDEIKDTETPAPTEAED